MLKILPTFGNRPSSRSGEAAAAATPAHGVSHQDEPLPWDWLFNASAAAVLIIDAASEKIVQGNPAAARLFGAICSEWVGSAFLEAFDAGSAHALSACLARARAGGRAHTGLARTLRGVKLSIAVTLFESGSRAYLLVHPGAYVEGDIESDAGLRPSAAFHAIDDASVGFLVADSDFRVEYANRGFLTLVKLHSQLSVRGTPVVRWLGLSAAQLASLREQLWSRRAIADLMTTLRPEHDPPRAVEVSAVAVPDGQNTLWGFCVRELARPH